MDFQGSLWAAMNWIAVHKRPPGHTVDTTNLTNWDLAPIQQRDFKVSMTNDDTVPRCELCHVSMTLLILSAFVLGSDVPMPDATFH